MLGLVGLHLVSKGLRHTIYQGLPLPPGQWRDLYEACRRHTEDSGFLQEVTTPASEQMPSKEMHSSCQEGPITGKKKLSNRCQF